MTGHAHNVNWFAPTRPTGGTLFTRPERETWMAGDEHTCPVSPGAHRAGEACVDYAREYGDARFVDHCNGADWSHSPPERCGLEALHEGRCEA